MKSPARQESDGFINAAKAMIDDCWASGLEIGTDGDEAPSGNYKSFWHDNATTWHTLDNVERLNPDVLFDLSEQSWGGRSYDLVVCSNVVEHCKHLAPVFNNLGKLSNKWLIIDTPTSWTTVPTHGTSEYGDYHRLKLYELAAMVQLQGFEVCLVHDGDYIAGVLAKKVNS